ncbi:MAG: DUF2793 domain-containing protein [Candidatus Lariskella arthropodorum]
MKDYVSKRLELIFLAQNQAQKELVANENFQKIECLINNGIISTTMTSPPVNPKYSDLYLLSDNSSGEWKGADGKLAFFTNSPYARLTKSVARW